MRIFIIDSGIGGLSVLKELKAKYPRCSFEYLADNANHPYGEKSNVEVNTAVRSAIESLDITSNDVLVVGCNTASCVMKRLNAKTPAGETYYISPDTEKINAFSGKTLVLSTKRTAKELENAFREGVSVYSPNNLPPLIEDGISDKELKAYLQNIKSKLGFHNNVVLACTHFSARREVFEEVFFDSNVFDVVSDCVRAIDLKKLDLYSEEEEPYTTFRMTKPSIEKLKMMGNFLQKG